jgi:hypothetical protein
LPAFWLVLPLLGGKGMGKLCKQLLSGNVGGSSESG